MKLCGGGGVLSELALVVAESADEACLSSSLVNMRPAGALHFVPHDAGVTSRGCFLEAVLVGVGSKIGFARGVGSGKISSRPSLLSTCKFLRVVVGRDEFWLFPCPFVAEPSILTEQMEE